jgi:hypothetical protein
MTGPSVIVVYLKDNSWGHWFNNIFIDDLCCHNFIYLFIFADDLLPRY